MSIIVIEAFAIGAATVLAIWAALSVYRAAKSAHQTTREYKRIDRKKK